MDEGESNKPGIKRDSTKAAPAGVEDPGSCKFSMRGTSVKHSKAAGARVPSNGRELILPKSRPGNGNGSREL